MTGKPTPRMDAQSAAILPTLQFEDQHRLIDWLVKNHGKSTGFWLQLAKKGVDIESVTYAEAVEAALCFGWIDGKKQAQDEQFWLQKFTPRAKNSVWSSINKEKALALIKAGKMTAAGIRQIELAQENGRWDAAYDSASKASIPADFQSELDSNRRAKMFFESLDSRNRYAILFRIQTAKKAETRAKKIVQFMQMLERHEKVHP